MFPPVVAAVAGALLRLIVAVLVAAGSESRGSVAVASCRHQVIFDHYDGYACDVIVTSSVDNDDSAVAVMVSSNNGDVPRNASALRLTLRRAAAVGHVTGQNGSRTNLSLPQLHFSQLGSLEVDVSETGSFPADLLSKLGAVSLQRLSVFRSALTDASEFRLRLPAVAEGTFATSNGSLSKLVLNDLGIEELPLKTFDGLTTLCFLSINNNRLSALPSGTFDDLCQLSSLSLARNRFVDVRDLSLSGSGQSRRLGCGRGLDRLRSLDLHGNRLRRVHAGAFQSLHTVVEINLSGNELSVVDAGAFSALVKLRTLYIDANHLVTVAPAMFDGLPALTTLDVSRNRLSNITSGAFRYLTALRTLRLHENEIEVVMPDAWTGLDELTELDLASNRLTVVDESMFTGLCSLRRLDLSDNEVTVVRAESFVCLTALEQVDLSSKLLSDAERRQMEERRWWSKDVGTGPPASCDKCGNASVTATSAETDCRHSVYSAEAVDPCDSRTSSSSSSSSSSAMVRLGTTQILAVALAIGVVVALLFLTLAAALYMCLVKRQRAVIDCDQRSATSKHSPHSGTYTHGDSIHGMYVKFHT